MQMHTELIRTVAYVAILALTVSARVWSPKDDDADVVMWVGFALLGVLGWQWWFRDELMTMDANQARNLRRLMLGIGVVLFVMNVWPRILQFGPGWSENARWGMGIGAALIVLSLATKPKDESL